MQDQMPDHDENNEGMENIHNLLRDAAAVHRRNSEMGGNPEDLVGENSNALESILLQVNDAAREMQGKISSEGFMNLLHMAREMEFLTGMSLLDEDMDDVESFEDLDKLDEEWNQD